MGQYADDIINGSCDSFGDYTYKYNTHQKETEAEKNIRLVRKELAILIQTDINDNPTLNKNNIVNEARRKINIKYGNDWRTRGLISNNTNQWLPLNNYPILN